VIERESKKKATGGKAKLIDAQIGQVWPRRGRQEPSFDVNHGWLARLADQYKFLFSLFLSLFCIF